MHLEWKQVENIREALNQIKRRIHERTTNYNSPVAFPGTNLLEQDANFFTQIAINKSLSQSAHNAREVLDATWEEGERTRTPGTGRPPRRANASAPRNFTHKQRIAFTKFVSPPQRRECVLRNLLHYQVCLS